MSDVAKPRTARIIAVANQKGGVGKTTTAINVAAGMAEFGLKVLVVDLDPQGNASTGLGIETVDRTKTSYDLLFDDAEVSSLIKSASVSNVLVIPANAELASADIDFVASENRSFLLRSALRRSKIEALNFDYILIDCPPSLSFLTVNALVAADSILIPLQSEFFALEGLSQLLLTIRDIRRTANPTLRIEGVVLTMSDGRNRLSQQVEADARSNLGQLVFETTIPRNVRVSEAPSFALPVITYDPTSKGAEAYRNLTAEIVSRQKSNSMSERG